MAQTDYVSLGHPDHHINQGTAFLDNIFDPDIQDQVTVRKLKTSLAIRTINRTINDLISSSSPFQQDDVTTISEDGRHPFIHNSARCMWSQEALYYAFNALNQYAAPMTIRLLLQDSP